MKKGIAMLLFGCAMYLMGILSAIMLLGVSDWFLWAVLILLGFIVGTISSILGLVYCLKTECGVDSSKESIEESSKESN